MDQSPRKLLLVQLRRIGDAVMITPALDAIREAWPESKVHLLTEYPACDLFEGDDRVDVLWLRPPRRELPGLLADLRRERFDLAVDFQSLPVTSFLTWATGAETVGFGKRFRRYHRNCALRDHRGSDYAADHKLDLLRMLGLVPRSILPRLRLPVPADEVWGRFPDRPRVVLSPVSPWPHKRWADEAFVEAARRIHEGVGAAFVIAGGPGEGDQLRTLAAGLGEIPHATRALTRIRELASLLEGADLFLGNDNGPRHIAVALGLPTIGYFSEVNPIHWTPPDPRHPVLWDLAHAGGQSVPSDRVILPPRPQAAAQAAIRLLEDSRPRSLEGGSHLHPREGTQ